MQHPIDLLPEAVRIRTQARARTGQLLAGAIFSAILIGVLAVHSRLSVRQAQTKLVFAQSQAEDVLSLEKKIVRLRYILDEANDMIDRYDKVALPLEISDVLATLVNALPPSITLDELSLDAAQKRVRRLPRSRGADDQAVHRTRVLVAELTGFAASDAEIAELVENLDNTPPLSRVSLDFSRTKIVNSHPAREFRLSFRVDLDQNYRVAIADSETGELGGIDDR